MSLNMLYPILSYKTVVTCLQLAIVCTSHSAEKDPKSCTQYSKFSTLNDSSTLMIPSRVGMIIIYTPALMVSLIMSLSSFEQEVKSIPLGRILCMLHFLKRDLEVLFLHVYSGKVSLSVSSMIGSYYAIVAGFVCYLSFLHRVDEIVTFTGVVLFTIGSIGNFYHHYLLANLRSSNDDKNSYKIPTGGLFDLIVAPHYFFELIAWLGIAFACNHLNIYLVFFTMASYLSGRAVAQSSYYEEKFPDKWKVGSRYYIIPFCY